MQEHFNENYLESDLYPTSTFVGKVLEIKANQAVVKGDLKIHGKTNQIVVGGALTRKEGFVNIQADFSIKWTEIAPDPAPSSMTDPEI